MRHFGVLIPSTNTTVEIEYTRLLPDTLQAHYGRMRSSAGSPFNPPLDADLAYQSQMLGDARVEVVALLQTSASLNDDGYDDKAVAMMTAGAKVPAFTSAQALGQAMKALGAATIALATPYSPEAIGRMARYFETKFGVRTAVMQPFNAGNAYEIGKLGPEMARDAFRAADLTGVDALVVPGGNFPTMPSIAGWEAEFGKPVLTTNQVVVWAAMRMLGLTPHLPGLGRLLAG